MQLKNFLFAASVIALSSCAVGPDYKTPQVKIANEEKGEWLSKDRQYNSEKPEIKWWGNFNDDGLNSVIDDAIINNFDVRIAYSNIKRARALARVSGADLMPTINAGATAERQGLSQNSGSVSGEKERDIFTTGLDISWELDIFGKNRRAYEEAKSTYEATVEDQRAVQLAVISDVATNYYQLKSIARRIELAQRNIQLQADTENLTKAKFNSGVVTEFDVARAAAERQQTEALLPNLQADLKNTAFKIAALTGKLPEEYAIDNIKNSSIPEQLDIVPIGLRSDILKNRPDIRTQERLTQAATAAEGVAIAQLYPSFSLTGDIGTSALTFGKLFSGDSLTYGIGGILNWPVFAGGRYLANVDVKREESKQAVLTYEKTVVNAIGEVESALTSYIAELKTLERLRNLRENRKIAHDIAKIRYREGQEDFLVVLDAERSLINIDDQVISSELAVITKLITLYKALGGGWEYAPIGEVPTIPQTVEPAKIDVPQVQLPETTKESTPK